MSDASYHTAEGMSNGAACSSTIGYHDKCDWVQFSKAGPVITALTSKPSRIRNVQFSKAGPGNSSATKRHKRHKREKDGNEPDEASKIDSGSPPFCSRCAFCAFLWLCLSSYRSCNPTKGVLVITQLFARWMPRPCAGEVHAWGYKTGVPVPRCPGLAPGRFTLGATKREFRFPDAPALCRGGSRLGLTRGRGDVPSEPPS
jgi:hypothetical protein